jgi:carotenoid cleavage dioxygenase
MNFGWDSSKDVYIGVLPRAGEAKDLRWFRGPCQFTSHVMNAFNEGTKVYFDVPVSESNGFPFFPDISGKPFDPKKAECRMMRWSLDFNAPDQGFEARQLAPVSGEFPRIDDRYAMQPYRHGYLAVQDLSKPFDTARAGSITGMFWNSIGHIDHATGKTTTFFAGATSSLQEPTFIPKSAHAREGEGYLVALANRYDEMRSDLLVLDAEHLDAGPIATIRLPIKLRNGLHGNWVSGAQLESC